MNIMFGLTIENIMLGLQYPLDIPLAVGKTAPLLPMLDKK